MADLNIGDLDYGFSYNGFDEYKSQIEHIVLKGVKTVIEQGQSDVKKALDLGWSGESRKKFDTLFDKACVDLEDALKTEYIDLDSRLNELLNDYVNQDKNMIIM